MEPGVSREDWLTAIKIFITVFLISAFFFKPDALLSRFGILSLSLAKHGTTYVEKAQQATEIYDGDFLVSGGHTYIEPSPGLSFAALFSYLPYLSLLEPRLARVYSLDRVIEFKITDFIMALSTVILFVALLAAIFFLCLRKAGCPVKKALAFSLFLYFGTPLSFYSLQINLGQDVLQASVLFAAFLMAQADKAGVYKRIFFSGLLAGMAVFINGTSLFIWPLFILMLISRRNWRLFIAWAAGAFLGVTPFLLYNQVSFGHFLITSYQAKYGSGLFLFDVKGAYDIAKILLVNPSNGLIFFFPFLIALVFLFKKAWASRLNRFILAAVICYTVCLFFSVRPIIVGMGYGKMWYLNQGGGGPRYLLPIIPFILYVLAVSTLNMKKWQKVIAATLMFICVIINTPGLFWTGGQPVFYNNFLIFCKNGFHSYMIDLVRDILTRAGHNVGNLSIFAPLSILGMLIFWIWGGSRRIIRLFE